MDQGGQVAGSCREEDREGSLAERIARKGFSTMRGKATAMRDVMFGALTGRIGDKEANTYCRGNREVRHDLIAGQKIGEKVPLLDEGVGLDGEGDCLQVDEVSALKARIAELEGKKRR